MKTALTFVPMLLVTVLLIAGIMSGTFARAGARLWHLATHTQNTFSILFNEGGWMVQRINRSSAEKVFISVKNNYATASLTNGQAVQWDFGGAADGVSVTRPTARATNGGFATAGIIAETIASSGYGLLQVWGYHSSVRMREMTGGTREATPGVPLVINAAGAVFCLEGFVTASKQIMVWPCAFMLAATSSWTSSNKAAFIKAL